MTRMTASRRKKTRYLSLRRRLAAAATASATLAAATSTADNAHLGPSALHTGRENLTDDDPHDHGHLSPFLIPSDDAVTLRSLLGPHSPSAAAEGGQFSPSSSSANYSACSSSYGSGGGGAAPSAAELARAALRGRERWWVEEEEEGDAASGGGGTVFPLIPSSGDMRRLSLKLDYDGILDAWSNERPLYVHGNNGLQLVPDILPTAASDLHYYSELPLASKRDPEDSSLSPVLVEVDACSGAAGFWMVPDGSSGATAEKESNDEEGEEEGKAELTAERREARVMRYKQKRRNRLFAKRIRYEVRKLNADKRPRFKGRFVKRGDDM